MNTRRENQATQKKLVLICQKHARQRALQAPRNYKETQTRAKKVSREVLAFWRVFERTERETERRLRREEEERRKIDVGLLEAKRQQRKLNFLITQTELYAHFISKKVSNYDDRKFSDEYRRILAQLDEDGEVDEGGAGDGVVVEDSADDVTSDESPKSMKVRAEKNVVEAIRCEHERVEVFGGRPGLEPERAKLKLEMKCENGDGQGERKDDVMAVETPASATKNGDGETDDGAREFFAQPSMFSGVLKCYQLKGLNWLIKLYDQGINGILADEMGLGKTIQSIAFLCHIAESYGIWGPFLIISPASTLHNWQQELEKFAPDFKIVPYWGNPNDRKVLRQFWDACGVQNRSSSFHIVVTSYQIVITDIKYFNKVRWQFMILDEAQAIKSSSSIRWKLLLSFNCRNRLLLSGTPIQNSMAELWALLHFIMPSLFDCHEEFNEWFSKDIENHAEHKTGIDERHLARLHMILKPFMLRRIKKDVENELSDKIEIMLYCPLSSRQTHFYTSLKNKILNEDLLYSLEHNPSDKQAASNLMNLVMQFRKVCNHPDLVEKRCSPAPYYHAIDDYRIARLLFEFAVYAQTLRRRNFVPIFAAANVYTSIFQHGRATFSFVRFLDMGFDELDTLAAASFAFRFRKAVQFERMTRDRHENDCAARQQTSFLFCDILRDSFFENLCEYAKTLAGVDAGTRKRAPKHSSCFTLHHVHMPRMFYELKPRISSNLRKPYTYSRRAVIHWTSTFRNVDYCLLRTLTTLRVAHRFKTPNVETDAFIGDSGKIVVLDNLLRKLKKDGHRVLVYSQMTKMIDLLEDFMFYRQYKYIRLDGSSKIADRRDMVADFQARPDIFVFLLSTRAGGLGINLTAADTVIFYDSDWNPTVDQQAMDRAHRLGQTKQVTVYRLICKDTIEETILQKATEKNEMQRMVINGSDCKQGFFKMLQPSTIPNGIQLEDKFVDLIQKDEKNRDSGQKKKNGKKPFETTAALSSEKPSKITRSILRSIEDSDPIGEPVPSKRKQPSSLLNDTARRKRRNSSRGRPKTASTANNDFTISRASLTRLNARTPPIRTRSSARRKSPAVPATACSLNVPLGAGESAASANNELVVTVNAADLNIDLDLDSYAAGCVETDQLSAPDCLENERELFCSPLGTVKSGAISFDHRLIDF